MHACHAFLPTNVCSTEPSLPFASGKPIIASLPIREKLDFDLTLPSHDNMADLSVALQQVCQKFGITELNPLQEEAIASFVINKRDVFVNLPTGFGKSLIYQAIPLIFDVMLEAPGHIVAVISPLVNLMKDQVEKLTGLEIPAATLSEIDKEKEMGVEKGVFSIIYGSPEA